jgi:hypothetical protein
LDRADARAAFEQGCDDCRVGFHLLVAGRYALHLAEHGLEHDGTLDRIGSYSLENGVQAIARAGHAFEDCLGSAIEFGPDFEAHILNAAQGSAARRAHKARGVGDDDELGLAQKLRTAFSRARAEGRRLLEKRRQAGFAVARDADVADDFGSPRGRPSRGQKRREFRLELRNGKRLGLGKGKDLAVGTVEIAFLRVGKKIDAYRETARAPRYDGIDEPPRLTIPAVL